MQKPGATLAMIAGILGVIAGLVTMTYEEPGGAFEPDGALTLFELGWGGLIASILVVVFGVLAYRAVKKTMGVLLMVSAALGVIISGTLVSLLMIPALAGGVLATMGIHKNQKDLEKI